MLTSSVTSHTVQSNDHEDLYSSTDSRGDYSYDQSKNRTFIESKAASFRNDLRTKLSSEADLNDLLQVEFFNR